MVKNPKKSLTKAKPSESAVTPPGYPNFIADLKERVQVAQLKSLFAINREMAIVYWEIGKNIVERQQKDKWNSTFIEKVGKIRTTFLE